MGNKPSASVINIALVGKSGNGKSSTGNTILRKEIFNVSNNASSCTNVVRVEFTIIENQDIQVTDTPGLMDTEMDEVDALKKICCDMEELMQVSPNGIHVLLLVLNMTNRFTEEEVKVLDIMKTVFGPTFIRDYCVIAMTHGDDYKDKDFMAWCKSQHGKIQELFKECQYRIVLFKNQGTLREKEHCVEKLTEMYSTMESLSAPYTNAVFKKCSRQRKRIVLEHGLSALTDKITTQISLLKEDLALLLNKNKQITFVLETASIIQDKLSKNKERALKSLIKKQKVNNDRENPTNMQEELINDPKFALYSFAKKRVQEIQECAVIIELELDLPIQFQIMISMIETPDLKALLCFIKNLQENQNPDAMKTIIIDGLGSMLNSMENGCDIEANIREFRAELMKMDRDSIEKEFNEYYPINVFIELCRLLEKIRIFASGEKQVEKLHERATTLLVSIKEEAVGTASLTKFEKEAEKIVKEIESLDPENMIEGLKRILSIVANFDPPTPLLIGGGVASVVAGAATITGAVAATVLTGGLAIPVIIGVAGGVTATSVAAATARGIFQKIKIKRLDDAKGKGTSK